MLFCVFSSNQSSNTIVVAGDRLDGEGEEVRDGGREWDVSSAARAGELPAAAARPDDATHAASQRRYVATM